MTNDIASLNAAVWKFGIQNREKFPIEFQLIANKKANNVSTSGKKEYSIDEGKIRVEPYFINFGNGFGNKDWEIWNLAIADQQKPEINT